MQYKVVGTREVAGKQPGEVVSESDLAGCNIEALIASGHLATSKTEAAKPNQDEEK